MIVDELILAFKTQGADKASKAVDSVADKLEDARQELQKYETAARKTGKETDKLALEKSRRLVRSLEKQQKALERTAKRAAMLKAGFAAAGRGFSGLSQKLSTGLAAGAGAGLAAVTASVQNLASSADQIKNSAESLGLTTKAYQELTYAADKNGLSHEQLAMGLKAVNARLNDVRMQGKDGESAKLFRDIGLSAEELINLSPDQQLRKIADAAKAMGNSAQRNARLARVLGEEAGPKFAELLAGGSEGLDELSAAAERYGIVVSREMLDRADEVAEAQTELKAAVKGLSYSVGIELTPLAKKLVEQFREWIVANRGVIATRVGEFVEALIPAMTGLAKAVTPVAEGIADLTEWFGQLNESQQQTVVLLGSVGASLALFPGSFGVAVSAVSRLVTAFGALKVAMAASGILAVAGAVGYAYNKIAGTNAAIEKLRDNSSTGNALQDAIGGRALTAEQAKSLTTEDIRAVLTEAPNAIAAQAKLSANAQARKAGTTNSMELRQLMAARTVAMEREANLYETQKLLRQELQDRADGKSVDPGAAPSPRGLDNRFAVKPRTGKTAKASDMKIADLIREAAAEGRNLDELLKNRKIQGGTPPTVVVTVNNNSTNVKTGDFIVKAPAGTNTEQVGQFVQREFETMMERVIYKNTRKGVRQGA